MKMSLKEGINTGNYYVLENRKFYRKRINGNEGILAEIKNIDKVSNQQNKMKKNQCSILEENKINETENKKTEQSKEKIYSKEEITSIMKKWDNFSDKIKFQKGAVIPVVDALISYLKINKEKNKSNIHLKFKSKNEMILNQFSELNRYLSSGTIKGINTFLYAIRIFNNVY